MENQKNINLLITGATGFIGGALAQTLCKERGFFVRGVSRREAPNLPDNLDLYMTDINEKTLWNDALNGVDVVIHTAARVHVMNETNSDPLHEYRKMNVDATINLATQAIKAGVRRFIFLSTIKVNGEMTLPLQKFTPNDIPDPKDPYGLSKFEAETRLLALSAGTGMDVVIIRPTLVYGPGVKGNFASMIKWLNKGVPLPLGSVNNKRSMIGIKNLVSFIVLCCNQKQSLAAANQVFLMSDGDDLSTTGLLTKVAHAYGNKTYFLPLPAQFIKWAATLVGKKAMADRLLGSLEVDSSKQYELLNWKPVVTIEEQLTEMALSSH